MSSVAVNRVLEHVTFLKDPVRIGRRVAPNALKVATSENTSDASVSSPASPKNTSVPSKTTSTPPIDPTKDKALIDAFSAAITAALSEEAA